MKRVVVNDDDCDGVDDDDDDDDGDEEGGGRKQLDVDERNVFRETLQPTLPAKHNHTSDSTFIDRFYDFVSRYVLSGSSLCRLFFHFFDSFLFNIPEDLFHSFLCQML